MIGLEDAHGKVAKTGDVLGSTAGWEAAAILVIVPVDDVSWTLSNRATLASAEVLLEGQK